MEQPGVPIGDQLHNESSYLLTFTSSDWEMGLPQQPRRTSSSHSGLHVCSGRQLILAIAGANPTKTVQESLVLAPRSFVNEWPWMMALTHV